MTSEDDFVARHDDKLKHIRHYASFGYYGWSFTIYESCLQPINEGSVIAINA